MIDVSPLAKALAQLEKSLRYAASDAIRQDKDLRELIRAAAIQAFEFTYDLAVKMSRRQLGEIEPDPDILHQMTLLDLMRTAANAGLVRDALAFRRYRELRNITSHTYDGVKAEEVMAGIPPFVEDIRFLLTELQRRNP